DELEGYWPLADRRGVFAVAPRRDNHLGGTLPRTQPRPSEPGPEPSGGKAGPAGGRPARGPGGGGRPPSPPRPPARRPPCGRGRAAGLGAPRALTRAAESTIAAGRVNAQARPILRTVSPWMPERLAHIVPATPEERTWVVLTGIWNPSAKPIVTAAISSAAAP